MAFHGNSAPAHHHPPAGPDARGLCLGANALPPGLCTQKNDAPASTLSSCLSLTTPNPLSRTVVADMQQEPPNQQQLEPSEQERRPLQEQPRTISSFSSNNTGTFGSSLAIAESSYPRFQGGIQPVVTGPLSAVSAGMAAGGGGDQVAPNTIAGNVFTSLRGGVPGGKLALFYMQLPLDEKKYVSEQARDEAFHRLRRENRTCFDCASRNPTWLSTTYGVYLCLSCSGKHRRLGTHISFVRSCEMDKFTPEQLLRMELGGNKRAHQFFREHGVDAARTVDYYGKLAARYKQQLDKLVAQEMNAAGWKVCDSSAAAAAPGAASSLAEGRLTTPQQQQQQNMQQQQQNMQQQQQNAQQQQQSMQRQQSVQQSPLLLGAGFGFVPVGSAATAAATAAGASSSSNPAGQLLHGSAETFYSPGVAPASAAAAAATPPPLSFAPSSSSNLSSSSRAATATALSGGGKFAGGTAGLLSQSNAIAAAPAPAAGTLRARKLDLDFDFEKEIAASARAAADHHLFSEADDISRIGGMTQQQQRTGAAAADVASAAKISGGDAVSNMGMQTTLSSNNSATAAAGGGAGGSRSAPAGLHSHRFTNAKSISSEQYFGSSSAERAAASFTAAVAVDPSKRSISSDEYFGIDSTKNRGKLSAFEDQAAVRLDSLKMAAQQGWATVASVGSDAMNRAKDWLQGS